MTSDQDLIRELRARAATAVPAMSLDEATVRAAGRRRISVRRWVASGSTAAAVLVLAVVVTTTGSFHPQQGRGVAGTTSPVSCVTPPTVEYTVRGAAPRSLPFAATVTVLAPVGDPVTIVFRGDCAAGGRLAVNAAGRGVFYSDLLSRRVTASWNPNEPGARTLLAVSWSCLGATPCPSASLGRLQVIAADAPTTATPPAGGGSGGPLPPRCSTADLSLGHGEDVTAQTGENPLMYALTNIGPTSCLLLGYPSLGLYDGSGHRLALRYNTSTGAQYVSSDPPAAVILEPGGIGYFLLAKYRCDTGHLSDTTTIRVGLPDQRQPLTDRAVGAEGGATLSYCQGGADDPGQVVEISPFVATQRAAFPRP
ncbi:DUF4232 domain-containing protein [Dermatophilaceae bacterium Soc4.6]